MNFLRRLRSFLGKGAFETEMAAEMRHHVELQTELNHRAGMNAEDARYAALRQFGNVAVVQEQAREGRGLVFLETLAQDLRYAIRGLRKSPVVTLVTLLTLAVGIGANTALFSVVNALLLRSLPVKDPQELVLLGASGPGDSTQAFPYPLYNKNGPNHAFPFSFYEHFQQQNQSLAGIAAFGGWASLRQVSLSDAGSGEPERVATLEVTGSYFPVLGSMASLGRLLDESDDQPGHARPVAVLSHALWSRRFGADPGVLGRSLTLEGVQLTVVGVAPRGFTGLMVGSPVDLWVPVQLSPEIDHNQPWAGALKSTTRPWLIVFGRLNPGVTAIQAEGELDGHFQRKLEQLDPRRVKLAPDGGQPGLRRQKIGLKPAGAGFGALQAAYEKPVTVLMAMVGVLLLVACANVAGLLLARGAAREREFAMRSALGASRWRVVTQIMTESVLLALLGGVLGVGVAWGGTHWLAGYLGSVDLSMDGRVACFVLFVTSGTGIIFGLLPAWRLSGFDPMNASKWTRGASRRLNQSLVVGQISLAFLLCIGAALLGRSFQQLASSNPGIQWEHLLLAPLDADRTAKAEQRLKLSQRLREELAALPGVKSATVYQGIGLLGPFGIENHFEVSGQSSTTGNIRTASVVAAGPCFFETMGISLIRGVDFTAPGTTGAAARPIVISEWSAGKLFGNADPRGQRIKLWTEFEVAGVARDIKAGHMREDPKFVFYVPLRTRPSTLQTTVAIRTKPGATTSLADLRAILHRLDPTASLPALKPASENLSDLTRQERFAAQLSAFFGLFVLILAGLGLFGLLSFGVTRRTREIGVRLALGASPHGIRLFILREGLGLLLLGSLVGAAAAVGLVRFAESLFYGVSPTEPAVYAVVFLLLLGAAALACWLPARRAAKVDPVIALRAE